RHTRFSRDWSSDVCSSDLTVVGEERSEEVAVSQMRKTIARRLSESKFSAPHFYLTMEINMDKVVQARKSMNEVSPVKLSFNDIVDRKSVEQGTSVQTGGR